MRRILVRLVPICSKSPPSRKSHDMQHRMKHYTNNGNDGILLYSEIHIFFPLQQLVSLYYAKPKEKESDCQNFTLSVELTPGNLMSFISSFFTYLFVCLKIFLFGYVLFFCFFACSSRETTKHVQAKNRGHVSTVCTTLLPVEKQCRLYALFLCFVCFLIICFGSLASHSLYRYNNRDRDATMSILDIGLLTGFAVETKDLDLVRGDTHINQSYI